MAEFDFEFWSNLYKENPLTFERQRKEFLEEQILTLQPTNKTKQHRLRALVFKMDYDLNKVKHPVARLAALKALFWKQVDKFQTTILTDLPTNALNRKNITKIKR